MKQYGAHNKQEFINEVLMPVYRHLIESSLLFKIKDADSRRVVSSHTLAQQVEGLADGYAAAGLKDSEISTYEEEALELINAADCAVKQFQKPIETIYLANGKLIKAVKTPIFYPNGDFFGIRTTASQLELVYPFQYIKGLASPKQNLPVLNNQNHKLSEDEKTVLYLLLNGHSRGRIAEILECNISKVSRMISSLCNRFGILANHQERLLTYAMNNGVFRFIPEPVVATISKNNTLVGIAA